MLVGSHAAVVPVEEVALYVSASLPTGPLGGYSQAWVGEMVCS